MWKLDGTTLTNQANVWRSPGAWIFRETSPQNYNIVNMKVRYHSFVCKLQILLDYLTFISLNMQGKTIQVGNATKNVETILRVTNNDMVIEQEDSKALTGKIWKKDTSYSNGYFTLNDPSSGKVITATSSNKLELKGKKPSSNL